MPVIDACVWISAALEDEINHSRAIAFFERIAQEGAKIVMPSLAITEVGTSIFRRTGDFSIAKDVVQIMQRPEVIIEPVTNELATRAFVLCEKSPLRGGDAVYLAVAEKYGETLVSFDRELVERGGALVKTEYP